MAGARRVSIRVVRFLGLGALVGIIGIGTMVGYAQVADMEGRLRDITRRHWTDFRQVDQLLTGFVSIRSHLTELVVNEGSNVGPIVKEEKSLLEQADRLAESLADEQDRELMRGFAGQLKKHRAAMVAYAQELMLRRTGEGVRSWEKTLVKLEAEAHDSISRLKGRIEGRVRALEADALDRSRKSRRLIVVLGSLGFALGVLILFILQRALAGPIARLCRVAEAVADGDLTREIEADSSDDIATLALAIGAMMHSLKEAVGGIQSAVLKVAEVAHGVEFYTGEVSREADVQTEVVEGAHKAVKAMDSLVLDVNSQFAHLAGALDESSSSTLELKSSIDEVSSFADDLAGEVDKITSSLVQMTAGMGENLDLLTSLSSASEQTARTARGLNESATAAGENARATRDLAENVTALAREQGDLAVREVIDVTRRNKDTVDGYSEVVRTLGERSGSISEVLDVIRSMADQTSLLAINAAIIAAQAGEQGKSFAVVAEEVGHLADSTSASVHRVEDVVKLVQKDVDKAVKLVDELADGAARGIGAAERAGMVFREIEERSSESARHTRDIADTAQEQADRSQEILQVVTRNLDEVLRIQQAMEEQKAGGDLVVKSAQLIRDTSHSLKASTEEQSRESAIITQAVVDLNQFAGRVRDAMEGEKKAVEEMVGALGRISDATGIINTSLGALKGLVSDLGGLADQLAPSVARFRLAEDDEGGTLAPSVDDPPDQTP